MAEQTPKHRAETNHRVERVKPGESGYSPETHVPPHGLAVDVSKVPGALELDDEVQKGLTVDGSVVAIINPSGTRAGFALFKTPIEYDGGGRSTDLFVVSSEGKHQPIFPGEQKSVRAGSKDIFDAMYLKQTGQVIVYPNMAKGSRDIFVDGAVFKNDAYSAGKNY